MIDLNTLTRRFLMGEGKEKPSVHSYVQSVTEIINSFRPRTKTETNRISIVKQHLNEIKKLTRKLTERVENLEEQILILEENKEKEITNE